jgi:hypothetical protein
MPPVKTWRAAAQILDIDEDTLGRKRKRLGDKTRVPWWENEEAVISWWKALIAPLPDPPAPKPARRGRSFTEPLDVRAKLRQLTRD